MNVQELVSSKRPYSNIRNEVSIIARLAKEVLPERDPEVPNFMWDICARIWDFNPSSRPSSRSVIQFLHYGTLQGRSLNGSAPTDQSGDHDPLAFAVKE